MATRINTNLVDDLDGTTANVTTVAFSVGSDRYEIDLSPANEACLRATLQPWIEQARKPSKPRKRRGRYKRTGPSTDNPADARRWAVANGFDIAATGRLPSDIIAAYNTSTND